MDIFFSKNIYLLDKVSSLEAMPVLVQTRYHSLFLLADTGDHGRQRLVTVRVHNRKTGAEIVKYLKWVKILRMEKGLFFRLIFFLLEELIVNRTFDRKL